MAGSSYIKLTKEIAHPRKGLINIGNIYNEYFKWFLTRYLSPQIMTKQELKNQTKTFKETQFQKHKISSKNWIHSQN